MQPSPLLESDVRLEDEGVSLADQVAAAVLPDAQPSLEQLGLDPSLLGLTALALAE